MRAIPFLFIALLVIITTCAFNPHQRESPERLKAKVSLFNLSKIEYFDNIELFASDTVTFAELKSLIDSNPEYFNSTNQLIQDLINRKGISFIINYEQKTIDFYIDHEKPAILSKVKTDYIVTYDPDSTWIEKQNTIGITDDAGFKKLVKLQKDWYYLEYWTKK